MLSSKTDFDTDDPKALRKDLQREHEDIAAELSAVRREFGKRVKYAGDTTIGASPGDVIVCVGFNITVVTPPDPQDGDEFTVIRSGGGNITVLSDGGDDVTIQGVANDVLSVAGRRTYQYANGGWWFFV